MRCLLEPRSVDETSINPQIVMLVDRKGRQTHKQNMCQFQSRFAAFIMVAQAAIAEYHQLSG